MGGTNSNPFREGGELLSEYTITHKTPDHFLTYLTHKRTQKEYLLRQITFTEQRQFTLNCERMKNRTSIKSDHLTHLERVEERKEDNMCSHYFKIYTLWEYPNRSLFDEVKERGLQRKPFENKEVWSILACSIMGLATLQQKDIRHQCLTSKVVLMDQGNIKIADPMAAGLQTNFQAIFNNRTIKSIYLSPEQCQAIQSQKPIINKNSYKNDVFTLGIILLECGLLQRQDQCYLDDCSKLNWSKVEANLSRFGHSYDDDLKQMVALMLEKDIRNRPDWLDLNKFVNQSSRSNFNSSRPPQKTFPKRDHYITRTVKSLMPHKQTKRQSNRATPSKAVGVAPERQGANIYYVNRTTYNLNQPSYTTFNAAIRQTSPVRSGFPNPGYTSVPSYPQKYDYQAFQPWNGKQELVSNPLTSFPTFNDDISKRIAAGYTTSSNNPVLPTSLLPFNFQSQMPQQRKIIGQSYNSSFPAKSAIPYNTSSPITFNEHIKPTFSVHYETHQTNASPQEKEPRNEAKINLFDPKLTKTPEIIDTSSIQIQPQYVEEHFKIGSRYEGYKLNGLRHGKGKFYYQDGGFYDGQWRNNKMEGFGTLYYQSDNKAYEGMWVNDQFHGQGKLYNDNPTKFDDMFDYNTFDEIDEFWEYYEGNFNADEKDGLGNLKFSNGQRFEGTFKKDMVEGEGTFYCLDGRTIHGIWRQNNLITLLD